MKFDIDMGDGTSNTKSVKTKKPEKNFLNNVMSNINRRKLPKNDTDTSNILPTKTRGEDFAHTFDIEEEKEPLTVIPEMKPLTSMTKPQLIAYINEKSATPHKSLLTMNKAALLAMAQAL